MPDYISNHITDINETEKAIGLLKKSEVCFENLKNDYLPTSQYLLLQEGLNALKNLGQCRLSKEMKQTFIDRSHEAFQLVFTVSSHHEPLTSILQQAGHFAFLLGDRRSQAIIDLQLSTALLSLNRLDESKQAYVRGMEAVKALGDHEITASAARYEITYYMLQGEPRKVLDTYERVRSTFQTEDSVDPFILTHLLPCAALSAAYTGDFQLGIRILKNGRHVAKTHRYIVAEHCLLSQLGWLLVESKDLTQARRYITEDINPSDEKFVPLSRFWMERTMAYLHFASGNIQMAYEQMRLAGVHTEEKGLRALCYTTPWFLEMIRTFRNEGYPPCPGFGYEEELSRILNGKNLHLKGVVYRLLASDAKQNQMALNKQIELLYRSEESLLQVSGQTELAKTWIEMARIHIENNHTEQAKKYIDKLRQLSLDKFPEDLTQFAEPVKILPNTKNLWPKYDNFMKLLTHLSPPSTQYELLKSLISLACEFFEAEIGAFIKVENSLTLHLEAGIDFLRLADTTQDTNWPKQLVFNTIGQNNSIFHKLETPESKTNSVLIIPVQTENEKRVLYLGFSSKAGDILEMGEHDFAQLANNIGQQFCNLIAWHTKLGDTYRYNLGQLTTSKDYYTSRMLFTSEAMRRVLDSVEMIARSDTSVLISGETGVGKELLALHIHERSQRANMPFVTIDLNCIPESLIESELFGHEKGAFTGAEKKKPGSFQLADKGTFFIDEIGEIPLLIQPILLRVLQERTFRHVGGTRTYRSDFRLIAATNKNLKQEVHEKRFREDLFHRLNVIPIVIPPLRERTEDIVLLANHFISQFSQKHNKLRLKLTTDHKHILTNYSWPGNIRELKNLMERIVVLQDLSLIEQSLQQLNTEKPDSSAHILFPDASTLKNQLVPLDKLQIEYISHVLRVTEGRIGGKGGAADILGMHRTTLYNRMKKLGIPLPKLYP